jgi:hypothetical protein
MPMPETELLADVATYLRGAGLQPVPVSVGVGEPEAANALPAIVLSLEASERLGNGIGERSQVMEGALPWQARIDLANPVLAEDPTFRLLDGTRRLLTLPHGGLVRADGTSGPLAGPDLTVRVAGALRTVVSGTPGAGEVSADPVIGRLRFGAALPAGGIVEVRYFLGSWEQTVTRMAGILRADVCAGPAEDVASLSDRMIAALMAPAARAAIRRIVTLSPVSVSSIGKQESQPALRRRTARLAFNVEHEINAPESSGGVIARVRVLTDARVDLDPSKKTTDSEMVVTG